MMMIIMFAVNSSNTTNNQKTHFQPKLDILSHILETMISNNAVDISILLRSLILVVEGFRLEYPCG